METKKGIAHTVSASQFDFFSSMGGVRGLVETCVPPVVFVIAHALGLSLSLAVAIPVGLAAVFLVIRLVSKLEVTPAVSGLIGIALAGFITVRSGDPRNFFVLGIAINIAYSAVFLLSLAVRRPLIGVICGLALPRLRSWRTDPRLTAHKRAFTLMTWWWVGLYAIRLAIQVPLYMLNALSALAVAKILLGPILFAFLLYACWRAYKQLPAVGTDTQGEESEGVIEVTLPRETSIEE